MVKIQIQKRGNLMIALPKEFVEARGWSAEQRFTWCPCTDGALKLVPLFK